MPDDYTRLNIGDVCPSFDWRTTDNEQVIVGPDKGRIMLLHFFILTCPHCRKSLHRLELMQDSLVDRPGLMMVSVGRGHTADELGEYKAADHSRLRMVPDPDRNIYRTFAERKVPRFYLFDRDGKLVHQVRGYNESELHELFRNASVLLGE